MTNVTRRQAKETKIISQWVGKLAVREPNVGDWAVSEPDIRRIEE
jgi:hypothetical protein